MARLTPTPHQEQVIQRMLAEPTHAGLNGSELGTGKTCVAAEVMHRANTGVNLITAPLHTLDGWAKAVDGQMGQEIRFANNKNKAGRLALDELMWGKAGTYFLGREYARLLDWSNVPLDFWVSDEALALDTEIFTGRGWKTVGEIEVGDTVAAPSGEMVEVSGLTAISTDSECFTITFDSGRKITTDGGHIWIASENIGSYVYSSKRQVTTREIFDSKTSWRIEMQSAVEAVQADLPIDPYVLGQWLGNGMRGQSYIVVREALIEQTLSELESRGLSPRVIKSGRGRGTARIYIDKSFSPVAQKWELFGNKHIPDIYLSGSAEQRLDLLRGLMDSDGYHAGNGSYVFTNTNENLLDGVERLVASLGFYLGKRGKLRDNRFTKNTCYRVHFSGNTIPFLLRSEGNHIPRMGKYHRINLVERTASVPVRCIRVDSDDHMFLAGRMMVPTHNCHSWSRRGTRGQKSAMKIRSDWKIAQSATWFGSTFENAWGVPRALWPDQVRASWWGWRDDWCRTEFDAFAPGNRRVIGEKNPGAWAASLPCYVKIESDLPELEPIEVRYELTPTQRKMYREMEQQSLTWLRDNPLSADIPIVQRIRLREIALAEPGFDEQGEIFFPEDAKSALFDTLTDLAGDLIGEQILMGTHSAKFARFAANRMRQGAYSWTGDKSDQSKAEAKQDFIDGRLQYLVATQKGIGEGVDELQHVSNVMFELSLDDSPVLNQQFRGRLNRRGQNRQVLCYRFVAEGTIDDDQHKSLLRKELELRQSSVAPRISA